MRNNNSEISQAELRRLLVEKQRRSRRDRLAYFQRTGKVVPQEDFGVPAEPEHNSKFLRSFSDTPPTRPIRKGPSGVFGKILLLVEVVSIGSLLWVMLNGIGAFRKLNQDAIQAFVLTTPTPTPLVMAVVLPSGHTPPTSPGGSRPNDGEIPTHLRPLKQSLENVPIPTPAPSHAIRIQIPAISIDAPVIQGTGWEQLKKGVGQYIGTVSPGQNGNMVLAAHNDIFGEIFRDLDQLQKGDQITVYSNQRAYTYVVIGWEIVEPTQVEVMNPTPDATATLISCYPYLIDTHRIVVKTKLVES